MNLLEIANAYQWLLEREGRDAANRWLKSIGLHVIVQKAVRDCYNDSGVDTRYADKLCEVSV